MKTAFTYLVIVYSYQNATGPVMPRETHTFASWHKMQAGREVERIVISWGPAPGWTAGGTVPGSHRSLDKSLADAHGHRMLVWRMNCTAEFYEAARRQRDRLVWYKMVPGITRRAGAVNCIHAVSSVAGHMRTGTTCGIAAGQSVADWFVRSGRCWQ